MAFQDVVTPRFYINYLEWILNNYKTGTPKLVYADLDGNETEEENIELIKYTGLSNRSALRIKPPLNTHKVYVKFPIEDNSLNTSNPIFQKINFAHFLGHNFETAAPSAGIACFVGTVSGDDDNNNTLVLNSLDEHSNVGLSGYLHSSYDGYSILGTSGLGAGENEVIKEIHLLFRILGSPNTWNGDSSFEFSNFGFGGYFDMMHSPELDLTYSKSYDGVQKQKSMGGATLVNYNYLRPPAFGNVGYFELSNADNPLNVPTRTGRRNYQLNFKYLENSTTKDSLFPQSENLYTIDNGLTQNDALYDDNSFYGNVIHMTQGGTIPFIFQADNSNFSGDMFSVCTFDQKDFNFKQVAPSVYDCSLKIVESW